MKVVIATNPIGLLITAIAVGAVLIIKYWTPLGKFFKKIFSGIIGWVQKTFPWISKLIKPLKSVVDLAGKAISFVFGSNEDEEGEERDKESAPSIGKVIKTIENKNVPISQEQQELLESSNIPNVANISKSNTRSNTSSNISISAPVTINNNSGKNLNEQKIADQVKEVFDELVRKLEGRKEALNFD